MRKELVIMSVFIVAFLIIPSVSADIIFNSQPNTVYNLGSVISVPITIKSATDVTGVFSIDLLCEGNEINFYKNGISIAAGQEKNIDSSLILTPDVIGNLKGSCKIKAYLNAEYALTSQFTVSDLITMNATFSSLQVNPGDNLSVSGKAFREDGTPADGIINLSIVTGNSSGISQLGTINKGDFEMSVKLPKNMAAGAYLAELSATEKDAHGNITNHGLLNQNINVNQIPTSLEIVFDNSSVNPGTKVRVKAVLHDQSGEKIDSVAILTIKDQNNKIMDQEQVSTGQFLEYLIPNNTAPDQWSVAALSNKLSSESSFTVLPKESISMQVVNDTIIATNTGNVLYNKTAIVKIGNETLNLNIYLDVGKSQKYVLSAPDGKYAVQISLEGNNSISKEISLTGNAVSVKKSGGGVTGFFSNSLLWVFVIFILGFVAFIVFKKGYQKTFFGYIRKRRERKSIKTTGIDSSKKLVPARNIGELSLSIKGEKQDVSVVALKIKNIKEFQKRNESIDDSFSKIAHLADSAKAITYENNDTIFFIIAPAMTRTFKNEIPSLELAMKIKEILAHHNKLFKQKIDFGISINHGSIVAKREHNVIKFMSMGTLITASKKIASEAKEEILLSERIYDRMRSDVKATKHTREGTTVFIVNEIRHNEDHNKFLRGFLNRMEKDKKEKEEKKK